MELQRPKEAVGFRSLLRVLLFCAAMSSACLIISGGEFGRRSNSATQNIEAHHGQVCASDSSCRAYEKRASIHNRIATLTYSNEVILVGSLLMLVSIVASAVSSRLGAPLLLVFLILGMLAGEDGPGGLYFDDIYTAQLVGSIALAIIIFDGGLRTRKEVFRVALWPAVSLATLGVIFTAAVVGAIATWLLDLNWMQGLLLGAIIGSTDAAAVFSLLHTAGTELKQRVASTLEIESASNDPMAIFLTMALVSVLAAGGTSLTPGVIADFIGQFSIGAVVGWLGGRSLGALINRLNLVTALYPLLAAVGGIFVFAVAAALGAAAFWRSISPASCSATCRCRHRKTSFASMTDWRGSVKSPCS